MSQTTKEPFALGFDIGGSTTKIGIVNRTGEILAIEKWPTDVESAGLDEFLGRFLSSLESMLSQFGERVVGIGGTFLGWIDEARSGPFMCINAPKLHGLDLRRILEDRFHLPVALIDDTNAHALGEYHFGSGRGVRRYMNLAMGTGLSAGVILYGQPLQFTAGCVGDTGHLILRPGGPSCSAGCKGCGEALIGVAGIERLAKEHYGQPIPARQVIEAARAGNDPIAAAVIQEIGVYVGELLVSLSHIFLPERISLTGGTSRAGSVLLEAARQRFDYLSADYHRLYAARSDGYYNGVEIVLGEVESEPSLLGATVAVFRHENE
jgi:glucokinase